MINCWTIMMMLQINIYYVAAFKLITREENKTSLLTSWDDACNIFITNKWMTQLRNRKRDFPRRKSFFIF
jgi:hypothetical protein